MLTSNISRLTKQTETFVDTELNEVILSVRNEAGAVTIVSGEHKRVITTTMEQDETYRTIVDVTSKHYTKISTLDFIIQDEQSLYEVNQDSLIKYEGCGGEVHIFTIEVDYSNNKVSTTYSIHK